MDEPIPSDSQSRRTLVETLAERLGGAASAARVFGEPVQRGRVTVIPVARIRYGFGGGSGRQPSGEEGGGGGGGVSARPLGYIELRDGASRYRPIRDPIALLPLAATAGLLLWWGLRRRQGR